MENQFKELGLNDALLKGIEAMGFETPTNVQSLAIPVILEGQDVIVKSKTGSGKTGAFGLPILSLLKDDEMALILTPTRELAIQIDHDLSAMKKFMSVGAAVVYGQHNMNTEIAALKNAKVITGTPGRVWDHIQQGNLKLNQVKYIVLDEADRMLDMGFFDQVIRIIKKTPKERMTLLFSATMPPEITKMAKHYMKTPEIIEIASETKTVDTIYQTYFRTKRDEKNTMLLRILKTEMPDSCMVFCNTRNAVDRVDIFLRKNGFHSDALHGANTQSKRTKTLQHFKKGQHQILVATDVAARGLHVEDLSLVINYDIPVEKDSYIHRIGRTGRAGNGGRAISMVTSDEIMSLYEIEEHVGVLIEEEEPPQEAAANVAFEKSESKWKNKPLPKVKAVQKNDRKRNERSNNLSERKPKRREQKNDKLRDTKIETSRESFKHERKRDTVKKTKRHYDEQQRNDVKKDGDITSTSKNTYRVHVASTKNYTPKEKETATQSEHLQKPDTKKQPKTSKGIIGAIKKLFGAH